jgi:ComF family protein
VFFASSFSTSFLDVFRGLVDLVAPPHCPACDLELLDRERGFCDGCGILLEDVPDAFLPPASDASLYCYGGPLADAIRRFKYGGRSELAGTLGALTRRAALAYAGHVDAIVPVPLHRKRLAERGFNQATLLFRPLARALAIPILPTLVTRVRATLPQAGLDASERAGNVHRAFVCKKKPPARVLVVDDVRTTGATLAAMSEALREAGAERIATLTLARKMED